MANYKDTTFELDITAAGEQILQDMAAKAVDQSGYAIFDRATRMAKSMSQNPPSFSFSEKIGINTGGTGRRAIATITSEETGDAHQAYVAHMALVKAIDAGRV